MIALEAGAATDVGRVRANNQDSHLVAGRLCAVADGMGGHQGGEVASALAIDTLRDAVADPTATSLVRGVHLANEAIFTRQAEAPELRGMGTTLCAVALVDNDDGDDEILVVNVGDSRVYLYRDDQLAQVTRDHSLVEDLRREGRLTDAEAAVHPNRNILTRALGIEAEVLVDDFPVQPRAGDRFLLCSDGLFNEVTEDRISATMRRLADPADAAHELVRQAVENGGRDNVTCVVVDVTGSLEPDTANAAGATGRRRGPLRAATATAPDTGAATGPSDAGDRPGEGTAAGRPPAGARAGATATEDDLAGFTRPVPAVDPSQGPTAPPDADRADTDAPLPRRRRLTWRVVLFVVIFLVVLAVAAGAIAWYARGSYFVAFNADDQVTIYQGQPGGVLWFEPTVAKRPEPALLRSEIPGTFRAQLDAKHTASSLSDAESYVAKVRQNLVENRSNPPGSGPGGSSTTVTSAAPSSTTPPATTPPATTTP